jgi:hypothetical protein
VNDKLARALTGLAVLAVAVIAAAVSFSHIEALALAHGYTPGTARLLPLSVDGLIVAASFTLLTEARAQRPAPRLARFGLVLGIAGTLAANIAYGVHFGPVGALVNAWPAAAFITATEILVGQMRRSRTIPAHDEVPRTVADAVLAGMAGVPATVPDAEPASVLAGLVSTVPEDRGKTVTSLRAPKRASGRKSASPERVFAAEIERGELPSLRSIKSRAHCGTPRAREIRDELTAILQEQPEAA